MISNLQDIAVVWWSDSSRDEDDVWLKDSEGELAVDVCKLL